MVKTNLLNIGVFFTFTVLVQAKLKCTTFMEKDVVCTGGTKDYVLERGIVSDNNKTTRITLRNCRIIEIEYEAFENNFNLKYIDLSENKISNFKLGVLDGNPVVAYLNLSHNLITGFPLGLFDQKPNLEVLDLKGNMINNLDLGIFDTLTKLKHLDLSSNNLFGRYINPYLFDKSQQITFMDFSRNDMSGTSDNLLHAFRSLEFLNLDRCSLTIVPKFATRGNLKTMKHLMLSTNNISKVNNSTDFTKLENLEILNFAENIINELSEDVLWPLRKLKIVIFRNNKLTRIPDKLFYNIPKLSNIDLSHNFIEYIPVNAFRGTSVRNLNLASNKFTFLENNFSLELRNSGARLKKFYFNENPWQCACLLEILMEVRRYDIEYNKSKYNGQNVVCITEQLDNYRLNCKRDRSYFGLSNF